MHVPPVGHFYFLPPSLPLFFAVRVIKTSSLGEIAAGGEPGGGGGRSRRRKRQMWYRSGKKEGGGSLWAKMYGVSEAFQLHSMPLRMPPSSPLA